MDGIVFNGRERRSRIRLRVYMREFPYYIQHFVVQTVRTHNRTSITLKLNNLLTRIRAATRKYRR